MRFSLGARVFLVVAGINAALFTLGGFYLRERFERADQRAFEAILDRMDAFANAVSANIQPPWGELNVARLLRWRGWEIADDAILVSNNLYTFEDGRVAARGVDLNPRGGVLRGEAFDRQAVLASLRDAMVERRRVSAEGGLAVPIEKPGGVSGDVWGACWIRFDPTVDFESMFQGLLPLFLISTLILTAGTFFVLRWLVLGPVEQLAEGAHRVRRGDFSVRLAEPLRGDELAELVRSFNAMTATVGGFNARLEREVEQATEKARRAEAEAMTQRRLAAMGELAAGIAHEINNPLGGLQNAVERLARGDLPPERRERYLELLRGGLERIGTTVRRLLRFTPRQAGADRVELAAVVEDALALVRHRAEREGRRLAVRREGAAPQVCGVRHELAQALLNLLLNALDALAESSPPGGGTVEVLLASEEGTALVAVRDEGPGVPPQDLERILDLFYTTKDVGKGSGLGLSLVHRIVAEHGGRLRVANRSPRGLEVAMLLPLVPTDAAPAAGAERPARGSGDGWGEPPA